MKAITLTLVLLVRFLAISWAEETMMPALDGEPWTVAGNPDLGKYTSPKQQVVDFAVWQAADGTWQLWACVRATLCGGKTRLFHRWEGKNLTDPLNFGVNDDARLIGTLPVAAPEIIRHNGQDYVACLRGDLHGIQIAKLGWRKPL